jgi:chromate transporter
MLLPGPEALQLVIYTAWLLFGTWMAIIAGLLFIIPSIIFLLVLSFLYCQYGHLPLVASMLLFIKPAVVAMVIGALIKIGKKSLTTSTYIAIAIISFVLIYFFKIDFALLVFVTLFIGALYSWQNRNQISDTKKAKSDFKESEYFIHQHSTFHFEWKNISKISVGFICICLLPIGVIYFFSTHQTFWYTLSGFFTKAAFVTFGGAYAVLPYVGQVAVEKYNWLTHAQMMDGLALGETTPGPLIIVLQFVGYMAGYNAYNENMFAGIAAALLTSFYTFVPSFFMVLAGGPVIEKTKDNPLVKNTLKFVNALVVGVLANLCFSLILNLWDIKSFQLSTQAIFTLLWLLVSILVFQKLKMNVIKWIAISLVCGVVWFLVASFIN